MLLDFIDRSAARLMAFDAAEFLQPPGEPGLVAPGSVSWRVFDNPVALYIGGIAAVLLELGEPRVRHGVWDHTSFRRDPGERMRRTGMAAMMTVYGARSRFEAMAARVNRMHGHVRGTTPAGEAYAANDPALLAWVQLTASWAFLQAYDRYVRPLSGAERDRYYVESAPGAALYGVTDPPLSDAAAWAALAAMQPKLEPSPILDELIAILRTAPILPAPLRPFQRLGVAAAIDLLPTPFRRQLGLGTAPRLRGHERLLLRALARAGARAPLPSRPAAQAARRLMLAPA
jgi:uncharacterized protein (DUF2236 family)